jgi:putative transposase
MQVSRSGYYLHIKNCKIVTKENILDITVKALHKQARGSYGSRRIAKALQAQGYKVGRFKARSIMNKAGLKCKQRVRFKITTQVNPALEVADNILNREFSVTQPNKVWVSDITYLWTHEGWLYLAAVLDLYSRRIVGWSIDCHMREELTLDAIKMAVGRRNPVDVVMHHSDRGSQYTGESYRSFLDKAGFKVSMSRKGNCWDNAVMERFFGSLKSERMDDNKYLTRGEAKKDVIDYIEMFYNSQRLHSTLGYVSPMEFEMN